MVGEERTKPARDSLFCIVSGCKVFSQKPIFLILELVVRVVMGAPSMVYQMPPHRTSLYRGVSAPPGRAEKTVDAGVQGYATFKKVTNIRNYKKF